MTQDAHRQATYTITGPQAIIHAGMAAAVAEATGQPVRFLDSGTDEFAAALHGVLPTWQIEGVLEDYAHYRRGEASEVTQVVQDVTGRAAIPFEQFAKTTPTGSPEPEPAFAGRGSPATGGPIDHPCGQMIVSRRVGSASSRSAASRERRRRYFLDKGATAYTYSFNLETELRRVGHRSLRSPAA
ncbi:Rossmann-fold NAD(P)-binding domain-containing protein [Solicola gregarius]|uniref:Uncharacterized protein n=1 Tax=Solicola gregarius TaxID=2908642 RepID=A0AA46TIA6_9ACTN|nr:hypothetical protein [Solicola gregarius]UYM05859.1 hypothetical protein L0C25_01915 [Solicola gregarius]